MFCRICVAVFLFCGVFVPACAFAEEGCNSTLWADHIRAGGGNFGVLKCDAKGDLIIGNKIYRVFEYKSSGWGAVSLGVMEPGYAVETQNFDHVLDVAIQGRENSHAASLADNQPFNITITKGENDDKITILSKNVSGNCLDRQYDDKGKPIAGKLEDCKGAGWSLSIEPSSGDE